MEDRIFEFTGQGKVGKGKTARPNDEREGQHQKARSMAAHFFTGRVNKAGQHYFHHLHRVAERVHGDETKSVAWLHDILEDCPKIDEEFLRQHFTQQIVDAVVAITRK
jgi:(p)ppGpp synthase/HD superfamily hydrolase